MIVSDCWGDVAPLFILFFQHRVLMFMDIFNQPYDLYGLEVVTFYHFRSDQKFWNLPPLQALC